MKGIEKALRVVEAAIKYITYALVALMVINTSVGVFFRFVLNNALAWTEEVGRYMMIWVGFFGCALASRDNSHVGIDMFVNLFGPGMRKGFQALARLVVVAFLVIILAKSGEQLKLLGIQRSPALELPMAVPYSAVTFGIFMMLIENLAHFARLLSGRESAKSGI